jgi:hypothetical protein
MPTDAFGVLADGNVMLSETDRAQLRRRPLIAHSLKAINER